MALHVALLLPAVEAITVAACYREVPRELAVPAVEVMVAPCDYQPDARRLRRIKQFWGHSSRAQLRQRGD